jgi:phospholipase/carboxylesterase
MSDNLNDLSALAAAQGRLNARPDSPEEDQPLAAGTHPLGLGTDRDGVLYVPPGIDSTRAAPLVLVLHGATGSGERALKALLPHADAHGLLLLAPDSRRRTWDVLMGGFGPDVALIDRALAGVFARFNVDPSHIAIEGFSDGASYALSLGIANGDLFSHILAFSPGFLAPPSQAGEPRIFVSHGAQDQVLPITHCSRRLVPLIRNAGYDVTYEEFDGPHTVPLEIAARAVEWMLN